jgi:hypothetical protein
MSSMPASTSAPTVNPVGRYRGTISTCPKPAVLALDVRGPREIAVTFGAASAPSQPASLTAARLSGTQLDGIGWQHVPAGVARDRGSTRRAGHAEDQSRASRKRLWEGMSVRLRGFSWTRAPVLNMRQERVVTAAIGRGTGPDIPRLGPQCGLEVDLGSATDGCLQNNRLIGKYLVAEGEGFEQHKQPVVNNLREIESLESPEPPILGRGTFQVHLSRALRRTRPAIGRRARSQNAGLQVRGHVSRVHRRRNTTGTYPLCVSDSSSTSS